MDALLAPERAHQAIAKLAPRLAYQAGDTWREEAMVRLRELLLGEGIPLHDLLTKVVQVETDLACEAYELRFMSEPGAQVIGRLFVPYCTKNTPLVICLQGHVQEGMLVSWREGEAGEKWAPTGHDLVQQVLAQGFAAFALEQRGFGKRADGRPADQARYGGRCHNPSMGALLYGRTVIGERVHDISAAITAIGDLVQECGFPIDMNRVACTGNSGGGTAALYAACLDTRIKAVMPSSSLCQFDGSIAVIDHCMCNYVPSIRRWFEMGDIACLVAPRPLIVVHGEYDKIFPLSGTQEAMKTVTECYADCSATNNLRFVVGPRGHEFYPDLAWPQFRSATGW